MHTAGDRRYSHTADINNPDIQAIAEAEEAKGFARGIAQGVAEGRAETAKSLLADGMPVEFVAKHTSLSIKEVRKLKN